jgi:hypothetical protein
MRHKKIQELEKQIQNLQQSIDNPPHMEDSDTVQDEIVC